MTHDQDPNAQQWSPPGAPAGAAAPIVWDEPRPDAPRAWTGPGAFDPEPAEPAPAPTAPPAEEHRNPWAPPPGQSWDAPEPSQEPQPPADRDVPVPAAAAGMAAAGVGAPAVHPDRDPAHPAHAAPQEQWPQQEQPPQEQWQSAPAPDAAQRHDDEPPVSMDRPPRPGDAFKPEEGGAQYSSADAPGPPADSATSLAPAPPDPAGGQEVDEDALTIGRGRHNSIVLDDMLVSRQHVRITADDQGLLLEDLGSRNGTFVNGRRVERTHLEEGDRIGIGSTTFEVRDGWLVTI
ncbi:FHA domain-containing protein [Calidifontibacter sp. DB0510]|uniref:FHA domain-containing protein n=1 Tax=Metallococcus carri TaxID=1656884 RepID=A0A967B369_9MICO|nr:FHA domain-containing protein [Metallococcus carri]NHN56440.1 FHA domain-containing protein [Metallococcus carri]NOP36064.1 FHA domain-containing protein [Calidifontibacter sp. DB2511S]